MRGEPTIKGVSVLHFSPTPSPTSIHFNRLSYLVHCNRFSMLRGDYPSALLLFCGGCTVLRCTYHACRTPILVRTSTRFPWCPLSVVCAQTKRFSMMTYVAATSKGEETISSLYPLLRIWYIHWSIICHENAHAGEVWRVYITVSQREVSEIQHSRRRCRTQK